MKNNDLQATKSEIETAKLTNIGRKTKFDWESLQVNEKREFPYESNKKTEQKKQLNGLKYSASHYCKTRRLPSRNYWEIKISVWEAKLESGKVGIVAVRFK